MLTAKDKEETLEAAETATGHLRAHSGEITPTSQQKAVGSVFKVLRRHPRILHPATLSLKNEGDIKTCPDKQD